MLLSEHLFFKQCSDDVKAPSGYFVRPSDCMTNSYEIAERLLLLRALLLIIAPQSTSFNYCLKWNNGSFRSLNVTCGPIQYLLIIFCLFGSRQFVSRETTDMLDKKQGGTLNKEYLEFRKIKVSQNI